MHFQKSFSRFFCETSVPVPNGQTIVMLLLYSKCTHLKLWLVQRKMRGDLAREHSWNFRWGCIAFDIESPRIPTVMLLPKLEPVLDF